jgi:hypothetical protein
MASILRRPGAILRLEGGVLLVATLSAYTAANRPVFWIPIAVLLPDLVFLGKVRATKIGGIVYDVLHTYPLPSALMFYCVVTDFTLHKPFTGAVILWFMHIGFDRLLGRGRKYDGAFIDEQQALARALMGEAARIHQERLGSDNRSNRWGED